MIWILQLHDGIQMKSNHTWINYNRDNIAIRSHILIYYCVWNLIFGKFSSIYLANGEKRLIFRLSFVKAQVTLCRSGGPDLYDLNNRRERHGRLMKSWQHRTDIFEVCSVGKRSAVIGKPVRQSFTVKLCRGGCDCDYDLFMDRFQSCVESDTSWDCRT